MIPRVMQIQQANNQYHNHQNNTDVNKKKKDSNFGKILSKVMVTTK